MTILDDALGWHGAGCYVLPVRPDGSKAPAVYGWDANAAHESRVDSDIRLLFDDTDGVGLVCGQPSGQLEMLEVEGRAVVEVGRLAQLCADNGLSDVWDRLTNGYVEATPSGGIHWLFRVGDGPAKGNTKLARSADGVKWETRGQGGFVVVAPSAGRTHPTGRAWKTITGTPASIPTLTITERDALYAVVTMLDETPPAPEPIRVDRTFSAGDVGDRPGDDFEARTDWSEILPGWTVVRRFSGGGLGWRRDGKDTPGISATTGMRADADRLYVFSSSTAFEAERPYSKFGAYALLRHGGDHAAAARELRQRGYGADRPRPAEDWSWAPPSTLPGYRPFVADPQGSALSARDESQVATTQSDRSIFLEVEIDRLRVRREATRVVNAEEAEASFRPPAFLPTLTAELEIPDEPVSYLFDKIMPSGANVLLTAQYKTGKTTLVNQAAKALADTLPFLGRFDTSPLVGRIALFNYEVDKRQYRRWLRDASIENTDAVSVLNLRGERLVLTSPRSQEWIITWLRQHEITLWVVDPFARAYVGSGKSENDNTEVGSFLDTLDYIKAQAGVESLILPTHTGRGEMEVGAERARGATRLDDWADVRWLLTKDDAGTRFLSATGRDVEVSEEKLSWDEAYRALTFGGGDRRWERDRRFEDVIVEVCREQPGIPKQRLQDAVRDRMGGHVAKDGSGGYGRAYDRVRADHRIRIDESGRGEKIAHYAT